MGYRLFGAYAWSLDASILLLPVLVLLLVSLAFGLGTLVSALTTQYRDFTFLVGFGIQLLMYMSPVIFPLSMVHPDSKIRIVLEINPMTPVIENFRAILVGTPGIPGEPVVHCGLCAVGDVHRPRRVPACGAEVR